MKTKKIQNVTLNFIDVEDAEEKDYVAPFNKLFLYFRDRAAIEYPGIIEEENNFFYLYHMSILRENIVRWLPIKSTDLVLELDAECGEITSGLTKLSKSVVAETKSAIEGNIIAERLSDSEGLSVFVVNNKESLLKLGNTFDWIIVKNPYDYSLAEKLLSENGHIVLITDNRHGLKYFSGEKYLNSKEFFSTVRGKEKTAFTLQGIEKIVGSEKFKRAKLYYPYPDFRFMRSLFSDERLPKLGELVDGDLNLQDIKLSLFSEKEAFDAAIEDGSFKAVSNSYLLVFGSELETKFARFSNERAGEYAIYTSIDKDENGLKVLKHPLTKDSVNHILKLKEYEELLTKRFEGSTVNINKCLIVNKEIPCARFEYVEGKPLSELMDECLNKDNLPGFYKLFDEYVEKISFNEAARFSDLDMVFSNIIVNEDKWTITDYEWCKESSVPVKEIAFRAIYCFILEDEKRKKIKIEQILDKLDLSKAASEDIIADEITFQNRVKGKYKTLRELREGMMLKAVNPIPFIEGVHDSKDMYKFQIYREDVKGEFKEENSSIYEDAYVSLNEAKVLLPLSIKEQKLRIDPFNAPCIVTIKEAKIGEYDYPVDNKKALTSNGERLSEDTFLFNTCDPNFTFELRGKVSETESFLYVDFYILPVTETISSAIEGNLRHSILKF